MQGKPFNVLGLHGCRGDTQDVSDRVLAKDQLYIFFTTGKFTNFTDILSVRVCRGRPGSRYRPAGIYLILDRGDDMYQI